MKEKLGTEIKQIKEKMEEGQNKLEGMLTKLLAVAGGYLFSWDFSALNPRPMHSGMVPYSDEDQPRLCSDLVRATCKPATQATWGPYMTRGDPAAEGHRAGRLGPPLG